MYVSLSFSVFLFILLPFLRNDRGRGRGCCRGCRGGGTAARTVKFVFFTARRFTAAHRVRLRRRERYRRSTVSR